MPFTWLIEQSDKRMSSVNNDEILNSYISELKRVRKFLNYDNYERTIYQQVCSYVDKVKSIELKYPLLQAKRRQFLEEVVKVYDRVLDLSNEHYFGVLCL